MRQIRCTICGKPHGKVYRYRKLLQRFGYKGHCATMECVGNLPRPDMSNVALFKAAPREPALAVRPRRRAQSVSAADRTGAVFALVSGRTRAPSP